MDRYGGSRLVAVAAVALLGMVGPAPGALHAGDPPWDPPPCASGALAAAAGAAGARSGAWFTSSAALDASGALGGVDVRVGVGDDARGRRLDLPPESFATGPAGEVVLVGDDDGTRSRLRLVHPGLGCAIAAGTSADVIRGALVAPSGDAVYEHRVDRETRADLGIWRRPLDGGAPRRVLGPVVADAAYGPTFTTELAWADDGRLLVASCGEAACRVRVLDPAKGRVAEVAPTGPVLGLAGGEVVAYARCPGLPCDVETIGVATGARRVLVPAAGPAALVDGERTTVVYEDGRDHLRAVDVRSGSELASAPSIPGALPVGRTTGAGAGATVTDGAAVFRAPGGPDGSGTLLALSSRLEVRRLPEVAP